MAKLAPHLNTRALWLIVALSVTLVGLAAGLGRASASPSAAVPCVDGFAGEYPCANVDLLAQLSIAELGGGAGATGNDVWGWADSLTSKEYALVGLSDSLAFVDISDPENPAYLGSLPTHTTSSTYRDMAVYQDHAYIIADNPSLHGMQIFDLTQLRDVVTPTVFAETGYYGGFGNAHNLFINEATGYAYVMRTETCSGAFHILDLADPLNPTFAGCFDDDGLTSDTQCVIYTGPDADYQGHEICFTGSDDAFTIGDVSDKSAPVQIDRLTYSGIARAHQGWLTEDQSIFLLSDINDEEEFGHNTRTYIWDVSDLDAATLIGQYDAETFSVDHNLYVVGDYVYQSNFQAGLRVLDVSDAANGNLIEVAYFDTHPGSDSPHHHGAFDNHPFFSDNVVVQNHTDLGLFIFRVNLPDEPTAVTLSTLAGRAGPNHAGLSAGLLIVVGGLAMLAFRRVARLAGQ